LLEIQTIAIRQPATCKKDRGDVELRVGKKEK
jgi:hypothetical protein